MKSIKDIFRSLTACTALIGAISAVAAKPQIDLSAQNAENIEVLYLETNLGDMVIHFFTDEAIQKHVEQVKSMARLGMYNGVGFPFFQSGYFLQIDDVKNNERELLPAQAKAVVPLEEINTGIIHERGTVSMTPHDGSGRPESALTIALDEAPGLDTSQTVIGEVQEGLDLLAKFETLETTPEGGFVEPVQILSALVLDSHVAKQRFKLNLDPERSESIREFNLYAFILIVVLAVAAFFLYSKMSNRHLISMLLISALVAAFGALSLLSAKLGSHPAISIIIMAGMVALYKFMNRFESQKA